MIKATPFHSRAADRNQANAWTRRAGYTLSEFYSGVEEEALSARTAAVISDISYRARLHISGGRAEECLMQLATRDVSQLAVGAGGDALWLDDNAVPQGDGVVARLGPEHFLLQTQSELAWIDHVAGQFGLRPERQDAGLALIGPSAGAILSAAGLAMPEQGRVEGVAWNGLDITLSRFGAGVELWCSAQDAALVWDRLQAAGAPFGLLPAGLAALDVIDMETHVPRTSAVDEEHTGFTGRSAWLTALGQQSRNIVGIDIDSETPAPHALLMRRGKASGQIGASLYSPALGRAIGLAEVSAADAAPGTEFTLTLPPDAQHPAPRIVAARIVSLPLLAL